MSLMSLGVRWVALAVQLSFFLVVFLLPIILGFTFVRGDANRVGQPGWLWAVLTILLGWLALLVYAVMRWSTGQRG